MENFKQAKLNDCGGDLDKQWFVYFSYKHPETKQFVRLRQTISLRLKTKTARHIKAGELIKTINQKLLSGWNPFADDQSQFKTIIDAIYYIVNIKIKTTGKRSARDYRNKSEDFINWLKKNNLNNTPASQFSQRLAFKYMDSLINRNISNRYYNNIRNTLSSIFNVMVEREFISINPFKGIKKLKPRKADISAYSTDELNLVNETLPEMNFPLYVIVNIIFYCFIRPQEIVRLRIRDISFEKQLIIIPASVSKNGLQQTVIIPNPLLTILHQLNLNFPPHYYIFSSFLIPGISEISPSRISDHWSRYRKKVGLTKNIYDFKHTGAGMCLEVGINARDLQLQLRHHSLEVTQIYLDKFNNVASDRLKNSFPKFKP